MLFRINYIFLSVCYEKALIHNSESIGRIELAFLLLPFTLFTVSLNSCKLGTDYRVVVVFVFFLHFQINSRNCFLHIVFNIRTTYIIPIYCIMIKQHISPNILSSVVKVSLSLFLVNKNILSLVLFPNVKRTSCFPPRNLFFKYILFYYRIILLR